ncbi:MAG: rhodanese-related sulfurtransferase [Waddliaceae bacterium]|jgi:hypothetical protein|nr:rhodanese-related sulfurtransferase [Waddliaceae bacterium]MBT7264766.1 rhodanese-related sulfurtransferase [Waddliaceae bacterium]
MKNNILFWIQEWYKKQCDNDWEHQYGVLIETLDNPGWTVTIDLIGTLLENKEFHSIDCDFQEDDWFACKVDKYKFEGRGGVFNLINILQAFKDWAES